MATQKKNGMADCIGAPWRDCLDMDFGEFCPVVKFIDGVLTVTNIQDDDGEFFYSQPDDGYDEDFINWPHTEFVTVKIEIDRSSAAGEFRRRDARVIESVDRDETSAIMHRDDLRAITRSRFLDFDCG